MANLIIRPSTGAGNKVIVQDQAGTAVLTTADSGATIANATLNTGAIGSAVTGFTGVKNIDTWRVHTNFTGSATPIASNWERDDTAQQVLLGTGMTESSGVFSFPATGIWHIFFQTRNSLSGDSRYLDRDIWITLDNGSNWVHVAGATDSIAQASSSDTYTTFSIQSYVDITDISNQKCRFTVGAESSSVITRGDSLGNKTFVQFTRMGDT